MTELSGFLPQASSAMAGIAISSLWQGLLLAGFAFLCLKLTPRLSASMRFVVWAAVFVTNLLLPLLTLAHRSAGSVAASNAQVNHPFVSLDGRWALALAAVWLAIAATRAVGLIRNAFRVHALYQSSTVADLTVSLQPLLERVAGPRSVQICNSTRVDQPCVIGFFRARILIPEWLSAKATPAEMRQIVLHESSHLRRWDDWTNLLQKLALVLFPLNPSLWWIERQLCLTREEACDEHVVRETRSPREYAACLTNLAAERMARRTAGATALSLGAWEHRSALAGRIHSILRNGSLLSPARARAIMAALVLATVGGAVELSATSQLVAFTSVEPAAAEFAVQAKQRGTSGMTSAYHDVVFREPTGGQHGMETKLVSADAVLPSHQSHQVTKRTGLKLLRSTSAKSPARPEQAGVRRISSSAGESRSWLIVTRWESSSDPQARVTIIQSVIHFSSSASADSTAANEGTTVPTQNGWLFFQM